MPKKKQTHAQRLDELQIILRDDYGQDLNLAAVSDIANWLIRFYSALIKLAVQRRIAEHEAEAIRKSLLDHS